MEKRRFWTEHAADTYPKEAMPSAAAVLYLAAGRPRRTESIPGICRICGRGDQGMRFEDWVRPTFTDTDKIRACGEIICPACQFAFDEASRELAQRLGKDKPQRMRNYSHIVQAGRWYPLSKADKAEMRRLILADPAPELIVLAVSGQKHLIFRAPVNAPGPHLHLQLEERRVLCERAALRRLLDLVDAALKAGFTKTEIERGDYDPGRIMRCGIENWRALEEEIRPHRGGDTLALALFLAQKEKEEEHGGSGGTAAVGGLAGD